MAIKIVTTADPLTVRVPLKPYLVKFIKKKFGKIHKASKRTWVGMEIIDLLTKDYSKPKQQKYDSFVTFKIPHSVCNIHGHFIRYFDFPKFENKCEKLFKDALYDHVKINCQDLTFVTKESKMDSILSFLRYYDITEDEFKLESLYRDFNRHQTKTLSK